MTKHPFCPRTLSVDRPDFWSDLAARVVELVPASLRLTIALDLHYDDPETLRFAREAAEKVMRAAGQGRLSLERGFGEVLLCLVALDCNPAAARAWKQALRAELS